MAKGFGIAALVLAILSLLSPYGINFAVIWAAMICAAVAGLNGDRGLTIASALIAFAGLWVFAPLTLAAILNAANMGDYTGLIFGFLPISFPIVGLVIDASRQADEGSTTSGVRQFGEKQ